jgi:hypothetical protein
MEQQLPGVYTAKRKDNTVYYRASITYRNKHISLGSYDNSRNAHLAYTLASSLLGDSSISLNSYDEMSVLPFPKWVSLINFRDNGIYFATPIYVRPKFFYYYFTLSDFFIFDLDDLFYYSSHRILRRGGHYFVADYGMQVNIMNRYGIKNYAVEGRDYCFINGNNQDLRYENIKIINRYNGVTATIKNGITRYGVKIHVKGDIKVGSYASEAEAAIAYNKAADLLKKAGINKAYTPNYLEGMSPAAYADLYNNVKISCRIRNYRCE